VQRDRGAEAVQRCSGGGGGGGAGAEEVQI